MSFWSGSRLLAVITKEFIQMRRDKTFAMMVGIPLMQLILFGYAINLNPRHLPTAIVIAEQDTMSRRILKVWKIHHTLNSLTPHPHRQKLTISLKRVKSNSW